MIRLSPVLMPIVQPLVQSLTSTPVPADTMAKPDLLANLRICLHGVAGSEGFVGRLDAEFRRLQTNPSLDLEPLFAMELKTLVNPLAGIFLFVDDEPMVRTAYSRFLRSSLNLSPDQVRMAENGTAALAVFAEVGHIVSAVVTDVEMPPGMDGFELYRELRGRGYQGPIIISSGNQQKEKEAPALFAGDPQAAFFMKPPDMTEMATRIRELLAPPSAGPV